MKGKISFIFVALKLLVIKKGNEISPLLSAKYFLAFFCNHEYYYPDIYDLTGKSFFFPSLKAAKVISLRGCVLRQMDSWESMDSFYQTQRQWQKNKKGNLYFLYSCLHKWHCWACTPVRLLDQESRNGSVCTMCISIHIINVIISTQFILVTV